MPFGPATNVVSFQQLSEKRHGSLSLSMEMFASPWHIDQRSALVDKKIKKKHFPYPLWSMINWKFTDSSLALSQIYIVEERKKQLNLKFQLCNMQIKQVLILTIFF